MAQGWCTVSPFCLPKLEFPLKIQATLVLFGPQVPRYAAAGIKGTFLDTGIKKHLPSGAVCGNPTVTHAPYLHPPLWFLSCFLYLFQNDSSNSTCSSKTKRWLVKLYARIWSHTQRLHSKALVTIVLTPEEQCFTCKIKKCQIYLCLSNFNPFLSDSTLWCVEWSQVCPCLYSRWQIIPSYRRKAVRRSLNQTQEWQVKVITEQTGYVYSNKLKSMRDSPSRPAKGHSLAHLQAANSHSPLNSLPVTTPLSAWPWVSPGPYL